MRAAPRPPCEPKLPPPRRRSATRDARAAGACFIGRLHIYVGSHLTNAFRTPESDPPPISPQYMFVMWFSGLRGGVAFALASKLFSDHAFPAKCGGLPAGAECPYGGDDTQAILQATLLIAVFTIFVFGGAITKVPILAAHVAPSLPTWR